MVRVYQASDVGNVRSVNEDSLAVSERVYVIADGMGGHAAGEVASRLLVETVTDYLARLDGIDEHILSAAVAKANEVILTRAGQHPDYKNMGTTATLLHLDDNGNAFWAHVGDSRLYLFCKGELRQITRDHSYVEELVESGSITQEEAQRHPRKNLLTRAVGVQKKVKVDAGKFVTAPQDIFLLCTDGLTNMVSETDVKEILSRPVAANPAQELIESALRAGGLDNVSAIVVMNDER